MVEDQLWRAMKTSGVVFWCSMSVVARCTHHVAVHTHVQLIDVHVKRKCAQKCCTTRT